jgi:DnaJ-class molecular chaperone
LSGSTRRSWRASSIPIHTSDEEAETKFKNISAANDLLKDKEKRRTFDAGEVDASGAERPQERFYRDFADRPVHASHAAQDGFASDEELEEFLARAFAAGGQRSQGTFRARGQRAAGSFSGSGQRRHSCAYAA